MPETSTREVKADEEVIDADKIDDGETTDEELEEEVVPPVEEEEVPAEEDDKKEDDDSKDPPESSPEGTEEEPQVPSKKTPAPVEGETPREKALRLQVQALRGDLRKANMTKGMEGEKKPTSPAVSERMKKLQETYTPEELRNMQEAIDVLAEANGYVKSSQTYQETVNGVVDSFIEENPEYKPNNDPEDARWNRFQEILKDGTYNLSGKTPKQLAVIFKKVKADVDEELGEPATVTKAKAKEVETRKVAAQTQKIKSVSHSGGSKAPVAKPTANKIDPNVRAMFKDFADEDLA